MSMVTVGIIALALFVGVGVLKFVKALVSQVVTLALVAGACWLAYTYGLPYAQARGWL